MKKCPKCYAENPLEAKFCRKCGMQFPATFDNNGQIFTCELFPEINFIPCSAFGIRLIPIGMVVLGILEFLIGACSVIFVFNESGFVDALKVFLVFVCVMSFASPFLYWSEIHHRKKLLKNTDYIEGNDFVFEKIRRTAKNGKLGLCNLEDVKFILFPDFDSITLFYNNCAIIEKDGKKGVFDICNRLMILPVEFERIELKDIYSIRAYKSNIEYRFDFKGNKLS